MSRCLFMVTWAFLLFVPSLCFAEATVYNDILVKINEEIITQYDLEEEMKPILAQIGNRVLSPAEQEQLKGLWRQTLDKMVNDLLMSQEIKRYKISVSDAVIDDEVRRVKEQRGLTDEQFVEMVKKDGLTVEEFRSRLKGVIEKQELLGYMVHSKVLVTDTEIQQEYEARRDDYLLEKMVELSIILLPSDISAIEVKKRIEDGEFTFVEAVEKYSVGPGKDKGGSIGEVDWQDLADDWKASIEGVPVGGVGSPIIVQEKEALLSPAKVIEDRLVPLEEVRDSIFENLMQKKREKIFDEYFEKLKQRSVIVYMKKI